MAKPKKSSEGVDLAIIMGGPKGKAGSKSPPSPMGDEDDADEMEMEEEDDDELPPDFVTAAEEAFPEIAGDTARLAALKRAIAACY